MWLCVIIEIKILDMRDENVVEPNECDLDSSKCSTDQNTMRVLQNSADILKKYFQILEHLIKEKRTLKEISCILDPSKISNAIIESICSVFSNPDKSLNLQRQYAKGFLEIVNYAMEKMEGKNPKPPYEAGSRDRRFQYETWYLNIHFDFLKQLYLMNAKWLNEMISQADTVDERTQKLAKFFIWQIIDAVSPTNFLFTNPKALQESISTNVASLANGMDNLLADLEKYKDIFDITRTDFSAFKVGENIACTPGQVVYKNELLELIYYTPTTKQIYDTPLLIIPPWINKYYILDLSPKNSFIKWMVSQGVPVFLISWVNPKENFKNIGMGDYMKSGVLNTINFILEKFKKKELNLLAYCVGGTLAAMLLAYLAKHKKEHIIGTTTFFATLIDFSESGDLSIFIDEDQLDKLEKYTASKGYFDGDIMNLTFSFLKANDMIWFFIINNYLMGKAPLPFDLLYWNADSTRFPAKMHSFYLRNMYLENNLIKPNKIIMDKTPLDLSKIKTPFHFVAAYKDHITPWKSIYKATNVLNCPCEFTLAGSGHVAGIINPADSNKYNYWTNDNKTFPKDPEEWLKNAKKISGSWWPYWTKWLVKYSGKKISATTSNKIANDLSIEKAPGSYVMEK